MMIMICLLCVSNFVCGSVGLFEMNSMCRYFRPLTLSLARERVDLSRLRVSVNKLTTGEL